MGSVPGSFFKKTLGRLLSGQGNPDNDQSVQDEEDAIAMNSTELETSGLQDKRTEVRVPVLPDGSTPTPLGSGMIQKILGEGGAAILYEVRNQQLGLQRAVKLLKPNYTRDSYDRFLREFRISIQLAHPNLAVVHTIGQWNKLPFIEMEKITGFSLGEISTQFGPIPTGLAAAIGIIICKSLEYIHACTFEIDKKVYKGLLHLDLKPSNILLSDAGVLKIMDFGLATPLNDAALGIFPKAGIGSTQYIAPELLFGKGSPDSRSDIYSLGCILYELLSGVKTFPGPEPEAVRDLRGSNTYVSLKKLIKSVPVEFQHLIESCLQFEKEDRPPSVDVVRRKLETIQQSVTRLTPENTIQLYVTQRKQNEPFSLPPPLRSQRKMLFSVFAIIGALALIAGGAFYTLNSFHLLNKFTVFTTNFKTSKPRPSSPPIAQPAEEQQQKPANAQLQDDNVFYAPAYNSAQSALMDSVRTAWNSRKFDEMLPHINRLPPELAQSKEVMLYKLRALGRGGEELGAALSQKELLDGEYFFHKARYQLGNKNYRNALINLDKAESLPCEFLDKRILGREVQLYKSRALTSIFRITPTSENLKAALDSWTQLLDIVKNRPNGMHSKEAEREMKNLAAEAVWRGIS